MKTVSFTDLRKKASGFIAEVEQGKQFDERDILVLRPGLINRTKIY